MTDDLRNGPLAYLASPFTLFESGHFAAFVDISTIAARLVQAGYKLICPVTHSYPMVMFAGLDPLDLSIWNPLNDELMARCDVLIVAQMDSWDRSVGIAREVAYFEAKSLPIYDCDPVSLVLTKRVKRVDRGPQLPLRYRGDEDDPYVLAHSKSPSEQGGASV